MTSQHDAVMAYYYMDEDNKVKVTEIFDVTKAESEAIFHESHVHSSRTFHNYWESGNCSWKEKGERRQLFGGGKTRVVDRNLKY